MHTLCQCGGRFITRFGYRFLLACGVLAATAGSALAGGVLNLTVHLQKMDGPARLEFSGDYDRVVENIQNGANMVHIASEELPNMINLVLLSVVADTGRILATYPIRTPKPYKSINRTVYLSIEDTPFRYKSIVEIRGLITRSPSEAYARSKSLHGKSIDPVNYSLAVSSAYFWFKASYALATTGRNADVNAMDADAIAALQRIVEIMEEPAHADRSSWETHWNEAIGRSQAHLRAARNDLEKSKLIDWNLFRYVDYYRDEGQYEEACRMLLGFSEMWNAHTDDERNLVASEKSLSVARMESIMRQKKVGIEALSAGQYCSEASS